jgi:hypothetical protein
MQHALTIPRARGMPQIDVARSETPQTAALSGESWCASQTVHTIILAKRLASACGKHIQASLPTSTERAKPKRLRPILGGSARPVDLKYWPATQVSDLYSYLARFYTQGPYMRVYGRGKWGM